MKFILRNQGHCIILVLQHNYFEFGLNTWISRLIQDHFICWKKHDHLSLNITLSVPAMSWSKKVNKSVINMNIFSAIRHVVTAGCVLCDRGNHEHVFFHVTWLEAVKLGQSWTVRNSGEADAHAQYKQLPEEIQMKRSHTKIIIINK